MCDTPLWRFAASAGVGRAGCERRGQWHRSMEVLTYESNHPPA